MGGESAASASVWDRIAPLMFDERRRDLAVGEVEAALRLMGLEPPFSVLDLACGPGRHAVELARRGCRVTGVDVTPSLLELAEQWAASRDAALELVHADMREFYREAGFDAVINMSTSFGYFEDPDDDHRVVSNVHRSLREGGSFLIELVGKESLARSLKGREWAEEEGVFLLTEQTIRADWSWVDNRLLFIGDEGRDEFVVSHRLYSAAELRSLLLDCDFASVQIFGDLHGSPYDESATMLVGVARK